MLIRILLVDSCTVLRQGLRLILEKEGPLTVVGEAANRTDALILIQQLLPTVTIIDPEQIGPLDGALIDELQATAPQSKLIILTNIRQGEQIIAAFRSGVKGYLHKGISGTELIQAIYNVAAGDCILPSNLTPCLLTGLINPSPAQTELTNRELDVLARVTEGLSNKEIAVVLSISENTVKTHVKRILAKLNLRSRTEAATYALHNGLGVGIK